MKFHVRVWLENGRIEHYYYDRDVRIRDLRDVINGWSFPREDSEDWFALDTVKGVSIQEFKGYLLNLNGDEIYCESGAEEEALSKREAELEAKLRAVKRRRNDNTV